MNIRDLRASVRASFALLLLTTASVHAASFDCAKAATQVEHLVCETSALSQLDDTLAAAYRAALTSDPSARERQTTWLRNIRNRCADVACLTSAYQAQIAAMAPAPAAGQTPPSPSPPAPIEAGQPSWTCPIDWSALADIDGPNPERMILGLKAQDWRKEHVEKLLRRQQECQRSAAGPDSLREAVWNEIQTRSYPNAIASIERRDQRMQDAANRRQEQQSAPTGNHARSADLPTTPAQTPEPNGVASPAPETLSQRLPEPDRQGAAAETERSHRNQLLTAAAVLAAVLAGWVWNKFVRNRCPKCKSTNIDTTDVSEVDRWRGSKKVTEQHSRGSRTRHVSATYVKNVYSYRCRDCQTEWSAQKKEEL